MPKYKKYKYYPKGIGFTNTAIQARRYKLYRSPSQWSRVRGADILSRLARARQFGLIQKIKSYL
jgi:hypothetical protein